MACGNLAKDPPKNWAQYVAFLTRYVTIKTIGSNAASDLPLIGLLGQEVKVKAYQGMMNC